MLLRTGTTAQRSDEGIGMHMVRVVAKLEPGGAQLALLRLTRELSREHGVDTTLLVGDATPDGMAMARRYGVEPCAYSVAARLHPVHNLQWQLSRRFAAWLSDRLVGADVVHAHMVGAWWATAQVLDRGTPFVATEHNQVNWTRSRVRALRPAAARIHRFYAMGPAARRFAIEAGVAVGVVRASKSPIAGLDGTSDDMLSSPRLTFTGRFDPDKGPDVLLEALTLLSPQTPPPHAYLLGHGPLRGPLLARARRHGLADRVTMPGWVEQPWKYVAGSDVHVVPSREEAWSQSAVLAMGLGVPVIGTAVDGLIDTLGDGRGITVAPDNPAALADAIGDVLAARVRTDLAAARRYAARFSAARVAAYYADDYRELVVTPRGRSTASISEGAQVRLPRPAAHPDAVGLGQA